MLNPLVKFLIERMEGKLSRLDDFSQDVDNYDAYQQVVEDVTAYWTEVKTVLGQII